jgi:hypothetical protein
VVKFPQCGKVLLRYEKITRMHGRRQEAADDPADDNSAPEPTRIQVRGPADWIIHATTRLT